MVNLEKIQRVHFIGIGGIGMSGLARLFLHEGKVVSGSDRTPSAITEALEKEGATIFEGQVAENITEEIDLVVYTEAMVENHPEMVASRALGVPMMNYFQALGLALNPYYLIAVAGTHGKTTTTAMLIDILEEAGLDPTAIVGSLRAKTKSNFRAGKSKYAVVEACEYRRDFLSLEPDILVITNLEFDHVDFYKSLADVQGAFRELAEKVPEGGFVVADTTHPNAQPILANLLATVIDYRQFLDLLMLMKQPGLHNRLNAAAPQAVAGILQIDKKVSDRAVGNFAGTWRRFEYRGEGKTKEGKVIVYDDYAHHPTEIKATMAGVRELYKNELLTVVFQSHTYTRTAQFFAEFVEALSLADEIILLPIYAAREKNESGVSSEKLAEALKEKKKKVTVLASPEKAVEFIKNNLKGGVVVTMGAGDMTTKVAEELVK